MRGDGVALMGRPKKGIKTVPARLSEEASRWAKIASAYTGESLVDYVSRVVIEHAREDADRYHAEATKSSPARDEAPAGAHHPKGRRRSE